MYKVGKLNDAQKVYLEKYAASRGCSMEEALEHCLVKDMMEHLSKVPMFASMNAHC